MMLSVLPVYRAVGISFSVRRTRSTMKRVNVSDHDPGSSTVAIGSRAPDCSLWGKLDNPNGQYPLLCHLLDTSAAALVIWDRWLRPGLKDLITAAISADDPTAGQRAYAVIAGLHDVGKASKVFQGQQFNSKRPSAIAAVVGELGKAGYDITPPRSDIAGVRIPDVYGTVLRRHEALSLFVASGAWPDGEQQIGDNWVGTVVGGHHGRFHPRFGGESKPADTDTADNYLRQLVEAGWGIQQNAHFDAVLAACGATRDQIGRPLIDGKGTTAIILLTGLVMLADWLASADASIVHGQSIGIDPVTDPAGWVAARRAGYFEVSIPKTLGLYEDLENPLTAIMGQFAGSLSPLQIAARSVGRGLWIATETTGTGKTEAAMLRHAAVPGEGIMFALPTRATTDEMFERMIGYFSTSTNAAALLHGQRSLNGFYANAAPTEVGLHATSWLSDSRNALFAPVSVGTCDQVLLGALRQKNTPVRLLALANRHVVIDEVHSFDLYQSALLEELLAWWGDTDTRVTLLSASLPKSVALQYARAYSGSDIDIAPQYPGHLAIASTGSSSESVASHRSYTLQVHLHEVPAAKLIDAHVERVLEYRNQSPDTRIAVVVNQVGRALEIGRQLAESGHQVIVLHSRMAAGHRSQIARELQEIAGKHSGHRGVIVVGTQIIESSLDLDFDLMVSDLAPAPALIQRAGRLWRFTPVSAGVWGQHRFPRPTPMPTVDVLIPTTAPGVLDPGSALPYLPGELRRTVAALREIGEGTAIPGDVQHLVDAASFDPSEAVLEDVDSQLELIAAGHKLQAADGAVVPMHYRHAYQRVLGSNTTYRMLSEITEPDELSEHSTRLVDRPTADCFIVEAAGPSKWVWRGGTAMALNARDPHTVRAVLSVTFPLTASKISAKNGLERIPGFDLNDEAGMRKRGPLQRSLIPVRLLEGAVYDDLLGVRLR